MRTRSWLMGVALALSACGSDAGSVPLDQLSEELAGASCTHYFDCCTQDELMEELAIFDDVSSVEECQNGLSVFSEALLVPSIRRGIDAGRIAYHADRMGACVDSMRQLDCAEFAAANSGSGGVFGDDCDNPIEGLVANGDPCASSLECISGECYGAEVDLDGSVTQEGVCQDLPEEGEECPGFECAAGLVCENDMGTYTCIPAAGEGEECYSDSDCASDNCDGNDASTGTMGVCAGEPKCNGV